MQQGTIALFEDYTDDGPMWSGDGLREIRKTINFDRQYFAAPAVMLNICLLDVRTDSMIRYELFPDIVTPDCFDIVFRTWEDSKFARVNVQWVAVGSATRDEYWVDY